MQNIITANDNLSKYGIGPKSSSSLPFYAGRWIDPASGRVRLLPSVTAKYINPTSYDQKVAFLQANIINKWNRFVDMQAQYIKLLKTAPENYRKKQN